MFKSTGKPSAAKVDMCCPFQGKQSKPPMSAAGKVSGPPQTKGAGNRMPMKASSARVSPPKAPKGR